MTATRIEHELEDFLVAAKSMALNGGYELEIINQKNIIRTLSDIISQISFKYDLWTILPKIEVIVDHNLLFHFYQQIDVYDGNPNALYHFGDFVQYYGEEETNVGEGKLLLEIKLTAEFTESLIFMSSYDEEEALSPIKDILKETDIIVNFDVSEGRIYIEVPIEVEVKKYFIWGGKNGKHDEERKGV